MLHFTVTCLKVVCFIENLVWHNTLITCCYTTVRNFNVKKLALV